MNNKQKGRTKEATVVDLHRTCTDEAGKMPLPPRTGPAYKEVSIDRLNELAWEYIEHCLNSTVEMPTAKGPCKIKQRHLPTTRFFLYIWLRKNHFDFFGKTNWYLVLKNEEHPLHLAVSMIDETFNALATDIVANEQKGIFYAKNKLGMSDKIEAKTEGTVKQLTINVIKSGLPPTKSENAINL